MPLPSRIRITEVGPRDGLQNESSIAPAAEKIALVNLLARAGFPEIEASSFVSPKWIPQLGDAETVFRGINRLPGVIYSALVPNEQGLDRALAAGIGKAAVFTAASDSFSMRNTNATIEQSIERIRPVVKRSLEAGLPVRGYISCVIACPFEGPVSPAEVRDVAARLLQLGVTEIDLGDTIGVAAPSDIERLYDELHGEVAPADSTLHLHDTRGTALACAYRAMQLGVTSFDASCGGLGGCPYAPGSTGNLATEDLVYLCHHCGVQTGIDLQKLFAATAHIEAVLGKALPGRVFSADGRGSASRGACSSGMSPSL